MSDSRQCCSFSIFVLLLISRLNIDSKIYIYIYLLCSSAPRSGLAAKHFIDVGGECLFAYSKTENRKCLVLLVNFPVLSGQLEL